jgi:transposase
MSDLIELTDKERIELQYLLTKQIESQQYQRALALILLDDGLSVDEIAQHLKVSRQFIYKWVARFLEHRSLPPADRLLDAARSGRPVTCCGIIDPLIDAVIDFDPRDYGFNSTVWTAELLRTYLGKNHKQEVSLRSIGYALERLRIRWKRPRHVLARQDLYWRQAKGG